MCRMKWGLLAAGVLCGALWAQPAPSPTATQATRPATEPLPAQQMLDQMLRTPEGAQVQPLRPGSSGRAIDRSSGAAAVAPGAEPQTVMREGSFIVDRIGRLTRGDSGQMEFTFESDGRSMQDPPVVLLPNLKLMMMENAVAGSNRDLRFRITGVVTEYKGRNYVLLDKVVVVQDEERQL